MRMVAAMSSLSGKSGGTFANFLTVFLKFEDKRNCPRRVVERNIVADLFEVEFGSWGKNQLHDGLLRFAHRSVL